MVFRPKLMIIAGISFDEQIGRVQTQIFQSINIIKLVERFLSIFVKIPDGMIEVEKDVFIFYLGLPI
jgi:hypothetical protein